jgi:RNA polymerase sigma-54 factor
MRLEQRQLLTPRMIQSMEILQLPLMALEERIEQELQNNPVLELRDGNLDPTPSEREDAQNADAQPTESRSEGEQPLVVKEGSDSEDDFDRLAKISEYFENEEFNTNAGSSYRQVASSSMDGERDKKQDALNNTAARGENLAEHLLNQWMFVEIPPNLLAAGEAIISYIDAEGYLRTPLEDIQKESKTPLKLEDLHEALRMIQDLEPAGVGARDLAECLLLQLGAIEREDGDLAEGHDFVLERALIADHLKDLEMNRYPQISKKLGRPMEEIKAAVKRLARLHPHPGKQVGIDDAHAVTPRRNHLLRRGHRGATRSR